MRDSQSMRNSLQLFPSLWEMVGKGLFRLTTLFQDEYVILILVTPFPLLKTGGTGEQWTTSIYIKDVVSPFSYTKIFPVLTQV